VPPLLDNLRPESDVRTSDGETVGRLHAVIVDPRENRVTHIAVNTGPFAPEPGFGDPKIVVVDIEQMSDATDDGVELAIRAGDFASLPPYGHTHFFDVPDGEGPPAPSGMSRLWDAGVVIATSLSRLGTGLAIPAEHFQRATFERHILEDSPVWRIEPNNHIGDVERVLVDEATDQIAAIVIRRGVVFHEDVVLPISYVTEIRDGLIRVQISNDEIEALEPFGGD
jgi:sporulation protein YlmC with PRC-barrel domain